eukprot:11709061-Alexandrium_andersonii.AAC.1
MRGPGWVVWGVWRPGTSPGLEAAAGAQARRRPKQLRRRAVRAEPQATCEFGTAPSADALMPEATSTHNGRSQARGHWCH